MSFFHVYFYKMELRYQMFKKNEHVFICTYTKPWFYNVAPLCKKAL